MSFVQDLTMWKSPARPVLFNHVSSAAKPTASSTGNSEFLEEKEAVTQCCSPKPFTLWMGWEEPCRDSRLHPFEEKAAFKSSCS